MIITKQQLEGLLDYYEMYGVEEMKFDKQVFDETIQNFGVLKATKDRPDLKLQFHNPVGRGGTTYDWSSSKSYKS